jgi:MoxR-like ATPase
MQDSSEKDRGQPASVEGSLKATELVKEIEKVFTGKRDVVELAVATLLAGGHLLLEDVPGVGKTTLARTLARALDLRFGRIQFTSDMLPSDVIGTNIFHPASGQFQFRPGPVFANVVLADEINRTSPRTQSALLEAMNERQVSLDGETRRLDDPFFVIATQNPKELHGTYPLPESQLDRFLLSLSIGYPDPAVESQVILGLNDEEQMHLVRPVLDREGLARIRQQVRSVQARQELGGYIQKILSGSREPERFELGASPRAGIQLLKASRAAACLRGRNFVTPDDIRWVAPYVLSHRLVVKNAGHLAGGRAAAFARVEEMLESIQVP